MALPLLASLIPTAVAGLGAGVEELVRRARGGPGGNFVTGYPGETKKFDRFTPQQQNVQNQSLQQALALLQGGKSPLAQSTFAPIEQKARSDFASKTVPSLAERFTSLGDSQRSSAFQGALGESAAGLEQGLAGLQSGQNLQLLQLLLGLGMQPSFENTYIEPTPGLLHGLAQGFGKSYGLQSGGAESAGGSLFNILSSLLGSQGGQAAAQSSMNKLGGS